MQIPSILTLGYWFATTPPQLMVAAQRGLLVLFVLCVLLGAGAYLARLRSGLDKLTRRALARVGNAALTMGFIGLALLFFDYERVSVLSMRVFYAAWLIGAAWWAWTIYRYITKEIPEMNRKRAEQENFNKWLPKAKK